MEPRKPLVKPGVAVKRLFWSPMFLNAEGDTVWHAIDQEGAAIDTAELEFLFAEKGALGPRTAASPHGQDPPAATKLRVLDEPRRRSVCVMLARLPPARETVAAVSGLAEAALDRDQAALAMRGPASERRHRTPDKWWRRCAGHHWPRSWEAPAPTSVGVAPPQGGSVAMRPPTSRSTPWSGARLRWTEVWVCAVRRLALLSAWLVMALRRKVATHLMGPSLHRLCV